jgi:ABC-type phosphate transport system substrate-binding protein
MKTSLCVPAIVLALISLFAVPSIAQLAGSDYVVVANKQMAGSSIDMAALKGIYLREIRSWGSGGSKIIVVDLSTSANGFYQNLFGKSYVQMQAYWLNMRIKYSVDLPVTKKDAESLKQFIAENKDSIGFLKSNEIDDRVKVLKVTN